MGTVSVKRAPKPRIYGAVCDRCSELYIVEQFPRMCLCPGCLLAILPNKLRNSLIARTELTGERIYLERRAS